jgi:hypothetical protein
VFVCAREKESEGRRHDGGASTVNEARRDIEGRCAVQYSAWISRAVLYLRHGYVREIGVQV